MPPTSGGRDATAHSCQWYHGYACSAVSPATPARIATTPASWSRVRRSWKRSRRRRRRWRRTARRAPRPRRSVARAERVRREASDLAQAGGDDERQRRAREHEPARRTSRSVTATTPVTRAGTSAHTSGRSSLRARSHRGRRRTDAAKPASSAARRGSPPLSTARCGEDTPPAIASSSPRRRRRSSRRPDRDQRGDRALGRADRADDRDHPDAQRPVVEGQPADVAGTRGASQASWSGRARRGCRSRAPAAGTTKPVSITQPSTAVGPIAAWRARR